MSHAPGNRKSDSSIGFKNILWTFTTKPNPIFDIFPTTKNTKQLAGIPAR